MDYEYGSENLDDLIKKVRQYPEKLSEADTRCKIIDEFLKKCLGWDEGDIRREEYANAGYIDYVIRFEGIGIIIEAKKTSIEFELPANINFKSSFSLGNLLKREQDLQKHYNQVSKYCLDSGIQFGCFTNGLQWIVFTAIRIDGIQIHRSKVVIFNGLKDIKENFVNFWNIFSKESFASKQINKVLLPEIGEISKSYIINKDERKNEISDRNILSGALAPVISGYFGDLIGEESIQKLMNCYVVSSPLTDKPLSKTIASGPRVFQHRNQNEASENLNKTINTFSKSRGHSGILYIILGRVGSGKSTFLYHFFFVSKIDITKNNLVYYLNFLEYREDQTISDFFYNKLEETSRNHELFQEFSGINYLEKIFQYEIET